MKKRLFGLILALTLSVSLIPVSAFAKEEDPAAAPQIAQTAEEVSDSADATQLPETEEESSFEEEASAALPEDAAPAQDASGEEALEEDTSEEEASVEEVPAEEAAPSQEEAKDVPQDVEASEEITAQANAQAAPAADVAAEPAERTILLYLCGTDLETMAGLASFNLRQVLSSSFSASEKIRFVVMTGGALKWQLESEFLCDPKADSENQPQEISHVYNQIWEAKGVDAAENPGKLVLLDGDGILGDGENAKRAEPVMATETGEDGFEIERPVGEPEDYEWLSNPEVLKAFINYGVKNFPAEKYDLILWDHGGGPLTGFVSDQHQFAKNLDALGSNADCLTIYDLIGVMQDNQVTAGGGRFDLIDFDACLMNSVEIDLAFMDYTDYYIASPETEPGYGQEYSGWLNLLGQNPEIGTFELGKQLVDDFHRFYSEGEGKGQQGTLAVIDMNRLRNSGFTEKLTEILGILKSQIDQNLYYDEIFSAMNSIQYGDLSYYDLGNFLSLLGISTKEYGKNTPTGPKLDNEQNEYTQTCLDLLQILSDESIIHKQGTEGIHTTGDFFYRNTEGQLKYTSGELNPLGTSGIYLYFPTISAPDRPTQYHQEIASLLTLLPNDSRKSFLSGYSSLMLQYALLSSVGHTVTYMAGHMDEVGIRSTKDITYDSVLAFWKEKSTSKFAGSPDWEYKISPLLQEMGALSGDEPSEAVKRWLSDLIAQQAKEVVLKENVKTWLVNYAGFQNRRIEINNTKKRVIEDVRVNLNARLPVLEQYLHDRGMEDIFNFFPDLATFNIGSKVGWEEFDLEIQPTSIEDYASWLDKDSSTWEIPMPETSWFALRDADGVNHVVTAENDGEEILAVFSRKIKIYDEESDSMLDADRYVYLTFSEDGTLKEIMMQNEQGTYRPLLPKDLKEPLELTPVNPISLLGLATIPAAISAPFILSAENASSIGCYYTDVTEIPDITELHYEYVLTDMYGSEINIGDSVENPIGELYSISLAEIPAAYYNGKEQSPVVLLNGKVLTEGKDYILLKVTEDTVMKEPGTYVVVLYGRGEYVGQTFLEFKILPAEPEGGGGSEGGETPVKPDSKTPVKSPDTGDPNNAMLWIALMILSIFAAAGGIGFSRKK